VTGKGLSGRKRVSIISGPCYGRGMTGERLRLRASVVKAGASMKEGRR
jgi:hypothetical protein